MKDNRRIQNDSTEVRTNPFDRILQRFTGESQGLEIEVREREDEYQVIVDLNEYSDDDVEVDVENGTLKISATATNEAGDDNYYSMSRQTVNRQIPVPQDANVETTTASINNGVLVVSMSRDLQ